MKAEGPGQYNAGRPGSNKTKPPAENPCRRLLSFAIACGLLVSSANRRRHCVHRRHRRRDLRVAWLR